MMTRSETKRKTYSKTINRVSFIILSQYNELFKTSKSNLNYYTTNGYYDWWHLPPLYHLYCYLMPRIKRQQVPPEARRADIENNIDWRWFIGNKRLATQRLWKWFTMWQSIEKQKYRSHGWKRTNKYNLSDLNPKISRDVFRQRIRNGRTEEKAKTFISYRVEYTELHETLTKVDYRNRIRYWRTEEEAKTTPLNHKRWE